MTDAMTPTFVVLAGSLRKGSFNKKLAKAAIDPIEKAGGKALYVDLADYQMPLYDADLEAESGLPDKAKELKKLLAASNGILIASPEYNGSITGVLKNTIDWLSRQEDDNEPPLAAFKGKVAALASASPGALGGLRGLVHVRAILGNIGVLVMPSQLAISKAYQAFDDGGALKDEAEIEKLSTLVTELVATARKLNS